MASANQLMKEMQKIASDAQVQVQKLANQATEKSFQYNAQEANTARQWQTEMSNTAHQREVKDLIKAGLNPVLATNNGAQSYTTSSASAQANDPSGAYGSLANALISSRTSAYGADTSAAATRAAAAQSAAATRYAAAQAASAQRYAAALSYDMNIRKQKNDLIIAREGYKNKLEVIDKTPPKNVSELVWKAIDQSGIRKEMVGSNFTKGITNTVHGLMNNPAAFFKQVKNNAITDYNFVLNSNGIKTVNNALKKFGIFNPTGQAQRLFIKAFVFHDYSALRSFSSIIRSNRKYTGIQM